MNIEDKITKYLTNEGPKWGKLKASARLLIGKTVNKKPDWNEAPDWANYLAVLPSSGWIWMEKKSAPMKDGSDDAWPDSGRFRFDGFISKELSVGDKWTKTLEKRP